MLARNVEALRLKEPFLAFFGEPSETMRSVVPLTFWRPCLNELRTAAGLPRDATDDAVLQELQQSQDWRPIEERGHQGHGWRPPRRC